MCLLSVRMGLIENVITDQGEEGHLRQKQSNKQTMQRLRGRSVPGVLEKQQEGLVAGQSVNMLGRGE